jgi:hypothetical protein
MPKAFDDMVSAIKSTLKKQNPKMKESEISSKAFAMATASWKKSHGGKMPMKEKLNDWRTLEFVMDISEKSFDKETDEFFIRGVAINETTTLNNVKYVAEELEKGAPSWRNVPILLDHKNEVKNIVGRTTEKVNWNAEGRRIDFEAKIMDKDIREMIKDGRISNVSIGAKVEDLIEEKDGSKKAVGIRGLEISLVAVPGDSHAKLAQAFNSSFHLKEMADAEEEVEDNEEEIGDEMLEMARKIIAEFEIKEQMSEDEMKKKMKKDNPEMSDEEIDKMVKKKMKMMDKEKTEIDNNQEITDTQLNHKEEKMEEIKTEAVAIETKPIEMTESAVVSEQRKELEMLKEILAQKKKINEELKALEVKKDETKGIVATEKVEVKEEVSNDYVVESAGNKISLFGDYSKKANLKRLSR